MLTHPTAKCRNESHHPQIIAALRKTARLLCFTAILGAFSTTPATGYANPGVQSFSYDIFSNLTSATDGDTTVSRGYDSFGGLLAESQSVSAGPARQVTHVTDDNGNLKKTVYPGGRALEHSHDALDRPASITDLGGLGALASYGYVGGRVARRTYAANGTQADYVFSGVLADNALGDRGFMKMNAAVHTVTTGGAEIDVRAMEWDADQNKSQRADMRTGGPGLTHDLAYDGRSRVTAITPSAGSPASYTYDEAGNRTNAGYALEGVDASLNNYTATPYDTRGYDLAGNLASFNARDTYYAYDANHRLVSVIDAAVGVEDDFSVSIPPVYTTQSGTWSTTGAVLSETTAAAGRILREFPMANTAWRFSYKSPHDPGDESDYDPERYGLALLRVLEPASPDGWRYVALVIEPTGIYLREWQDNALLGELGSAEVDSKADTWYDLQIEYAGADKKQLTVKHGKTGQPFKQLFSVTVTLGENAAQKVGFGTGATGNYSFKDILIFEGAVAADITVATYQYDALGRRIAKTIDPGGTPVTTEYIYAGDRIIEERNGSGTLEASYVYGNYVDEVLSMQRNGQNYFYHQDDQFNVMAVTGGSGAVVERYGYGDFGQPLVYDANGAPLSAGSAIGNPYLFTGREWDAQLEAYNYRSRYYDPNAGRFIARDQIGPWGDPQNLGNAQAYCNNNPWTHVDPYGEGPIGWMFSGGDYSVSDWEVAGGAVAGAGLGL